MQIVKLLRLLTLVFILFSYTDISYARPINDGENFASYVAREDTTPTEAIEALRRIQYSRPDPTNPKYPPYMYNGSSYYPKPSAAVVDILCNRSRVAQGDSPWYNIFQYDGNRYSACTNLQNRTRSLETQLTEYYNGYYQQVLGEGSEAQTYQRTEITTPAVLAAERAKLATMSAGVATAFGSLVGADRVVNAQPAVDTATAKVATARTALTTCLARNNGESAPCTAETAALASAEAELRTAQGALGQAETAANGGVVPEPCGYTTFWQYACIIKVALDIVAGIVLPIPALILSLAATLFDYSIYFTIITFGELLAVVPQGNGADTESAIYTTWIIIRNLFNIIIIFQLLKLALYKILTPFINKSSELKKTLVSIIIFTLFTNFSFFFTKALIDFSNITSLQFYSALGAKGGDGFRTENTGNTAVAVIQSFGIRPGLIINSITGGSGTTTDALQASAGGLVEGTGASQSTDLTKSFFGIFVLAGLLLIVAFILFQGAFIFISRSIILIFLVVFSPLMFARGILGPLEKWSSKWWEMLLEQLYVAPIYLAMLYITLKLAGGGTEGGILAIAKNGDAGSGMVALIFPAIIMAGLLFGTVKLAKEFGGSAAAKSSAFGSKMFGAVVGGGGGMLARKGLGRVANRVSNSSRLAKWGTGAGIGGATTRSLLTLADKGKTASFDIRNSSSIKKLDGMTGGKLGLKDLGTGSSSGGFTKEREQQEKDRIEADIKRSSLLNIDTTRLSGEAKKKAEEQNKKNQEAYLQNRIDDKSSVLTNPLNAVRGGTLSNTKTSNQIAQKALDKVKKDNAKSKAKKKKDDALEETMYKKVEYIAVDQKDASGNSIVGADGKIVKEMQKNAKDSRAEAVATKVEMQRLIDEQIEALEKMTTAVTESYEDFALDSNGQRIPDQGADGRMWKPETKTRVLHEPLITDEVQVQKIKLEIQNLKAYRGAVTDKWVENQIGEGSSSDKGSKKEKDSSPKEDKSGDKAGK